MALGSSLRTRRRSYYRPCISNRTLGRCGFGSSFHYYRSTAHSPACGTSRIARQRRRGHQFYPYISKCWWVLISICVALLYAVLDFLTRSNTFTHDLYKLLLYRTASKACCAYRDQQRKGTASASWISLARVRRRCNASHQPERKVCKSLPQMPQWVIYTGLSQPVGNPLRSAFLVLPRCRHPLH